MNAWTDCCLCLCVCVCVYVCVYVCVCGWVVRSTCLQGGAVYISSSGSSGTFTSCNFTSNSATGIGTVSVAEEYIDDCEMSRCMTLRLCPPCISS